MHTVSVIQLYKRIQCTHAPIVTVHTLHIAQISMCAQTCLQKFHNWYRVEEVESSKPVSTVGRAGYLSDGERGRVACEDGGAEGCEGVRSVGA